MSHRGREHARVILEKCSKNVTARSLAFGSGVPGFALTKSATIYGWRLAIHIAGVGRNLSLIA